MSTDLDAAADVVAAVTSRKSIRGFTNAHIPRELVEKILQASARAPSGNNIQPWKVHVLSGLAKSRLAEAILAARAKTWPDPLPEYDYYPQLWPEPYLSRRREVGWGLYERLGIRKGDREASRKWSDRNFDFFGAPIGMIFTIDRRLGSGALIDLGMFMQNIVTICRGLGLDTCVQAAFAHYHDLIRDRLVIQPEQMVVCGMALGQADQSAAANGLVTTRADVGEIACFHTT